MSLFLFCLSTFAQDSTIVLIGNGQEDQLSNVIKKVPLTVKHLRISNYNIGRLDKSLNKFPNLESLTLNQLQLVAIQKGALQGLSELKELSITENKLTKIPTQLLSSLPNLERVSFKANQLVSKGIPEQLFEYNTKLKTVNFSINSIEKFPKKLLYKVQSLEHFVVNNAQLKSIDSNFFDLSTELKSLDLSKNALKNIFNGTFTELTQLNILDLSSNLLDSFPHHELDSLLELQELFIDGSPGFTCISGAPEDTKMDIERCEDFNSEKTDTVITGKKIIWDDISMLPYTTKRLILRNCEIGTIPDYAFAQLPNLVEIDLSYCKIKEIEQRAFLGCENVLVLNLGHNDIERLPKDVFLDLEKLEVLLLDFNKINLQKDPNALYAFYGLSNLKSLQLEFNPITEIPYQLFSPLKKLENVVLNNCAIDSLPDATFFENKKLRSIDLSQNKIRTLKKEHFKKNKKLKTLILSNNKITIKEAEEELGKLKRVEKLRIDGNLGIPCLPYDIEDLKPACQPTNR